MSAPDELAQAIDDAERALEQTLRQVREARGPTTEARVQRLVKRLETAQAEALALEHVNDETEALLRQLALDEAELRRRLGDT